MKRKIRLAVLLATYFEETMGGSELQVKYLLEIIKNYDYDIHYIFLSKKHQFKNPLSINLHPIPKRKIWLKLNNIKYPYFLYIWRKLKEIKPDVIYQRCAHAFTGISALYAKKYNCKMIFHIASNKDVEVKRQIKNIILTPELKLIEYGIRNSKIIIAQTHDQNALLQKNYNREANAVIPNGHPIPQFHNIKKDNNNIIVLWIANWKPIKQPEIFIELVKKVGHINNVRYIMIGKTCNYTKLLREARKNKIEVLGEISNDEVNQWLLKGHILVNTSKQEGFSNTFIQAWMREVPVVSLNVDPDNVITKEKLGFCSGDLVNLVKNTKELIADANLRKEMGLRCRKYAIQNYSLQNLEKIIDFFV